jgi:hypothetical protein
MPHTKPRRHFPHPCWPLAWAPRRRASPPCRAAHCRSCAAAAWCPQLGRTYPLYFPSFLAYKRGRPPTHSPRTAQSAIAACHWRPELELEADLAPPPHLDPISASVTFLSPSWNLEPSYSLLTHSDHRQPLLPAAGEPRPRRIARSGPPRAPKTPPTGATRHPPPFPLTPLSARI